jgi:protein-L-isoaspartate(D-aspartate) O-methyltransferase
VTLGGARRQQLRSHNITRIRRYCAVGGMTGAIERTRLKLADLRRVYARQMLVLASALADTRLEDAFAAVPRERFLGSGPWRIMTPWWSPYASVPEQDPALIYQDVVVALDEARGINNGSPSLHAHWMHLVAPRRGESVAHIGAGAGYYSAILAELVGEEGRVTAVEFEPQRAQSAKQNLKDRSNVDIIAADGGRWPQQRADVIYVNFATPRPADAWIDNLNVGGRLIFPLGVPRDSTPGGGCNALALLVTRLDRGFAARALGQLAFVFAAGKSTAWSDAEVRVSQRSLEDGGWEGIKSLVWKQPVDAAQCWLKGDGWALSLEDPAC